LKNGERTKSYAVSKNSKNIFVIGNRLAFVAREVDFQTGTSDKRDPESRPQKREEISLKIAKRIPSEIGT
jgi:hypothetical protein